MRLAAFEKAVDHLDVLLDEFLLAQVRWPSVQVWERRPENAFDERREPGLVGLFLIRQRERHPRPSVERVLESDHVRFFRERFRDLDRVLVGFSPGVEQARFLHSAHGSDPAQSFRDIRVALVRGDKRARVQELFRLRFDCFHDCGIALPDVQHADSAGEVDDHIPVQVRHQRVLRMRHGHRRLDRHRLRHPLLALVERTLAFRPRNLGLELDELGFQRFPPINLTALGV